MQNFIIEKDISGELVRVDDADLLHQMRNVLRFEVGDKCMVLDGKGVKAKGEVLELHRKGASIKLSEHEMCTPPARAIRLYCALANKLSTFELIVQKATELNVTDIIPLTTERSQVDHIRKPERLKAIIKEATEQCGRCFLPVLHEVQAIGKIVQKPPTGIILVGEPWKYKERYRDILVPENEDVNVVIGPEGGFTDPELKMMDEVGGRIFLLGNTILRMETAAIAVLSVVQFT
ncbi:16S rRNA (uracil(1498)-N(3))-methyltransferase [Patescibacteria group bacterium]|nr:16S rRNA (uracil(1498)-N(3))-methyltransferase [Patescibacteria group bacterium]